jgi:hypothetical protein
MRAFTSNSGAQSIHVTHAHDRSFLKMTTLFSIRWNEWQRTVSIAGELYCLGIVNTDDHSQDPSLKPWPTT